MNLYKKCTAKPYSCLVIDATPASNKSSHFRKNIKTKMTIDDKIRDEKLQYDINKEAAKISALSSRKIEKYEYLTSEEILPFYQIWIIKQAKFTYSSLGKAFKNKQK